MNYRCRCSHAPYKNFKRYLTHINSCGICGSSRESNAADHSNLGHDDSVPAAATREDDDDSVPYGYFSPSNSDIDDDSSSHVAGLAGSAADEDKEDDDSVAGLAGSAADERTFSCGLPSAP